MFVCYCFISKARQRGSNYGFHKEDMSQSVTIVSEGEKFYEISLLKVDLYLKHIFLRFTQNPLE